MLRSLHRVLALVALTLTTAACSSGTASHTTQPASKTVTAAGTSASPAATTAAGLKTREAIDVNGVTRTALIYVPGSRSAGKAMPAIIVLHGAGGSGGQVAGQSQTDVQADRLGFIAVYPDGEISSADQTSHWYDGRPLWGTGQPPDDVAFMGKLLDLLVAKYKVDPSRISAVGFSNGGFMAARLACDLPDRVAAIAVIAGPRDDSACAPQRPVSVLVVHGTADPIEPYTGGPDSKSIPVPAEADVVAFWRMHDGCAATPATSQVTTTVELQTYASCTGGNEVRFYTVQSGGHMWPNLFDVSKFDSSAAIADFLLAHPLTGR